MLKRNKLEKEDATTIKKKRKSNDIIKDIEKKFEAINIFSAFCDAHLTTAVTFQGLQKAVADLTIEDLAAINVIIPNFVKFNPVSKESIEIEFENLKNEFSFNKSLPTIKPDAVKKFIKQQNDLFKKSLTQFKKHCKEKNIVNINDHLLYELEKHIPMPYLEEEEDLFGLNEEDTNTNNNISIPQLIEGFKSKPFYHQQLDNLAVTKTLPSKAAILGESNDLLSQRMITILKDRGLNQLYIHQTEALKGLLHEGQHVIVSTSTASCREFTDRQVEYSHISTFDGDTPSDQRSYIRNCANIIFTNPDMLHHAILPNSKLWNRFLSKLKYVVVDELHVYNGLFGTHVAFIMRRLRRLCEMAGNNQIQFISCSATISNPDKLVDVDGAPHGKKEFIIWNPPLINPTDKNSERRGAIAEGADLLEYLLENNIRTIAFCKMRKTCELLMKQVRENLQKKQRKDIVNRVMSYRGGYTAETRRNIESQMFNGELLGIIATNALELGIDIGSLDAVLMVGVPWSISALWQQSGRSGRRNEDSLSLIICDNSPLDQHYALYRPDPRLRPYPSQYVKIRNIDDDLFAVVDITDNRNIILEEVELQRVGFELYEGAVFIHQGRTYLVEECNIDKRYSKVHLARVDWTTSQRDYTDVDATSTKEMKYVMNSRYAVSLGRVKVSTVVFGYYRIDKRKRIIDSHEIYMDPIVMESNGIWTDIPGSALTQLKCLDIDPMAAIHAACKL
ncbi:MAG: P-loop containing nucleoside triphosphate hydrolase protein [Benjaminiella poitrasii]|nr:MAG: P-loop containing nucleoside triphosphate hydrolase protein [Benjaminiella poitrasii]